MKFKLNDRVSWSIFNLTGTVTDVLSDIVYIKWDEGNHTISYNAFECRNMEVMPLEFKVGDRVVNNYSKNKGVIIRIDKYVEHTYASDKPYFKWFKWDAGDDTLPTNTGQSMHSKFTIKLDDINEPYLYTNILNFHLDTDQVLATKEADTPVFKVGDRIAHKKSSNKGVIISNYRTILLAVQWDRSSEYFYISPKDLTLDNSIAVTNDKLKVTPKVDITLKLIDELLNVAEQKVLILVKQKDYDSAKQLLEHIELLNTLTKPK
jgi:co-chaperonin GroES (HSP10)